MVDVSTVASKNEALNDIRASSLDLRFEAGGAVVPESWFPEGWKGESKSPSLAS